jgi:hypothetical protein
VVAEQEKFRNRIVGHADIDPITLVPNIKNWRTHPDRQKHVLNSVMTEVGWVGSIIVNKRTGVMLDGHLRAKLAADRGEPTVPVTYVDLSEDEEALILATLDPITELAGADATKLEPLLAGINTEDLAIQALMDDLREQSGITIESLDDEDREVKERAAREVVVQFNIVFDNEEHQQVWYGFLRWLRKRYPDTNTVSQRLHQYISELDLASDGPAPDEDE